MMAWLWGPLDTWLHRHGMHCSHPVGGWVCDFYDHSLGMTWAQIRRSKQ